MEISYLESFLLLLLSLLAVTEAKKVVPPECYHCTYHSHLDLSGGDVNCKKPGSGVMTTPCPAGTCAKQQFDTGNYYSVVRFCAPYCKEMDIDAGQRKGRQYCCQGNLCNHGHTQSYCLFSMTAGIVTLISVKLT